MPSIMRTTLLFATALLASRLVSAQSIVVFADGARMEVQSYEIKEGVVLLKTKEGKLMSVPRTYVNLPATEQANKAKGESPPPAARPAAPPARAAAGKKRDRPRDHRARASRSRSRADTDASCSGTAGTDASTPASRRLRPRTSRASPPPVWSNEELHVSLVVPSAAWIVEEMPASFDIAAALDEPIDRGKSHPRAHPAENARGGRFSKGGRGGRTSISQAPGFRRIANGPIVLEPYTAHEFRFVKDAGSVPVFNRLVVVYSRDLAYVLSLSCPEVRADENAADFEALVRGLVVKKSRKEILHLLENPRLSSVLALRST